VPRSSVLPLVPTSLGVVPAGAAVALPAGKANWVVSAGGLTTPDADNHRDWVRLGYYVFTLTNRWNCNQP
jgi:hypothetical protein